jgi:hypothetical protein
VDNEALMVTTSWQEAHQEILMWLVDEITLKHGECGVIIPVGGLETRLGRVANLL